MTDILYRSQLHNPEQARAALTKGMLPWLGQQLEQGHALVLEARLLDDDITDKQRAYLHGVVLAEIAQQAVVDGRRWPMAVWKEHFRREFLGHRVVTVTNPMTGRKSRRRERISTEDLGVRRMAEYIDRVIAHAAKVLGVAVSEPLPPELRPGRRKKRESVDPETGEVLEHA